MRKFHHLFAFLLNLLSVNALIWGAYLGFFAVTWQFMFLLFFFFLWMFLAGALYAN